MNVTERFLHYIKYDTQSDEHSQTTPSTKKQLLLGNELVKELHEIGIDNALIDEFGYVYASINATSADAKTPTIGLIAHMDTSPDMSGEHVQAKMIPSYDGKDIVLDEEKGIVMRAEEYSALKEYVGHDLIVTDGTTLLGADDKAGIAEIMSLAEYYLSHPDAAHPAIAICFTPDEEIGSGADHFDLNRFHADYAYTIDGGQVGEITYENFNAASANISIKGSNIHPGDAKGKMRNALLIAMEFNSMLPCAEIPGATEKYEGFYHLTDLCGDVEHAELKYILRDHDLEKLEDKKKYIDHIVKYLNEKYGTDIVQSTVHDSYYNMKEKILPHFHLVENALDTMKELGINPIMKPQRGGTDGARLSFMGLPCPNLGTGGQNFHGKYEYISVQAMELSVELIKAILMRYAQKKS
ncbi:MAG: peptidase T [Anaerofustis sp.]